MSVTLLNPAEQPTEQPAGEKAAIDKRIVRKLDFTLIPWLCFLYLLAFLDRTNIGNAKVGGLEASLNLTTVQYNATLSIFFVSYALCEPATNIILKKLKPSVLIPLMMFVAAAKTESEKISNVDRIGWGIVMTLMGLVRNWSGLMASRWFLGLAEAGLFPGINFYLSCWYRRSELGIRMSIFVAAAAISGSFGGLLAAAIEKMNGLGGHPGWAWLFILEGIVTVIFGIASFWQVQDFPDTAKFLSPVERAHVLHRLQLDRQNILEDDEFRLTYLWMALKDYKTWLAMAIFGGVDMPTYALSMFLPSIINEFGYSPTKAQLLSAAPYVAGSLVTLLIGWLADRTRQRGLCNIFTACLGIIGFTLLLTFHSPHVRYTGTFFGAMGTYPCVSNVLTWVSNNIEGSYKRGIVIGMVIAWGNLNGMISSYIYFHAPDYVIGHATAIGYLSIFLLGGSLLMRWLLKRENRLRRSGMRDHRIVGLDRKALEELGDAHPGFMYTL